MPAVQPAITAAAAPLGVSWPLVVATMVRGEHCITDLAVAVPLAVAVQALCATAVPLLAAHHRVVAGSDGARLKAVG